MLTLGQIKNSSVANIASCDVNGEQFAQYVSDSDRMLNEMGEFVGSIKTLRGCVYDACMVWPKNVIAVLALRSCKHQIPVRNYWYQFNDDTEWPGINGYHRGSPSAVEFVGTAPVFRQAPSTNGILRFKVTNPADIGKTVTVYGADENGIMLVKALTLTEAGVDSPPLRRIEHVSKVATLGEILAFWFQPGTGIVSPAGIYQPNDLSPEYQVSRWHEPPHADAVQIIALCKLAAQPVILDTDMVTIDCLDAHKEMIQGIRRREAGDIEGAFANEKEALRRLNNQLNTRYPDDQFIAERKVFGDVNRFYQIR